MRQHQFSELKWTNLTKTDDILLALNRTAAKYIMEVRPFQYLNKTYRLIDNYVALPYMKCDVWKLSDIRGFCY